jgi:tRNA (guanine10-N2)-dimethyltransferase
VARYYAIVSGEHLKLAEVELSSILQAHGFQSALSQFGTFIEIRNVQNPLTLILEQAVLIREAGLIIGETDVSSPDRLVRAETMIDVLSTPSLSFAVFVTDLSKSLKYEEKRNLAIKIGATIASITKATVCLDSPDVAFTIIRLHDRLLLCRSFQSRFRKDILRKKTGSMPFFHPSMMNAALARILCNLAHVTPMSRVLDPFCGAGGILVEAVRIGAFTIGMDLNWTLLKGAEKNLTDIPESRYVLLQADARAIPIRHVDVIVTDPPYGRTSSTRGMDSVDLISDAFHSAIDMIGSKTRFCICTDYSMNVYPELAKLGIDIKGKALVRVHSGLTREIIYGVL